MSVCQIAVHVIIISLSFIANSIVCFKTQKDLSDFKDVNN